MQPVGLLLDLEIDPAADTFGAPCDPLLQNFAHAQYLGHPGDQDVEIAGEMILKGGHAEQLDHELVRVYAPLEVDGELEAAQIGFVPHIGDLPDLSGLDEVGHLVHNGLGGGGVGDFKDLDDILGFEVAPSGPELEAAPACGIDLPGGGLVIEQLAAGGEIGAGHGGKQVVVGIFHQGDGGFADLGEVEGADIAGHAHGDALIGSHQHIGEGGGQEGRLLHGGVVVVHHVHGVAVDVPEQLGAERIQLGLGVSGGGIGHIPGVDLAEVALGIHKGVEQRLIAPGQTHHGFIDGGVAVGV